MAPVTVATASDATAHVVREIWKTARPGNAPTGSSMSSSEPNPPSATVAAVSAAKLTQNPVLGVSRSCTAQPASAITDCP